MCFITSEGKKPCNIPSMSFLLSGHDSFLASLPVPHSGDRSCSYKLNETQNHRRLSLADFSNDTGEEKMTPKACAAPAFPPSAAQGWVSGASAFKAAFLSSSSCKHTSWAAMETSHPGYLTFSYHCWKECACSTSSCIVTIPSHLFLWGFKNKLSWTWLHNSRATQVLSPPVPLLVLDT